MSHKVITVERQGGYAARCEDCDAITFGGFATRSEARAALAQHEKETTGGNRSSTSETQKRNTNMLNSTDNRTEYQKALVENSRPIHPGDPRLEELDELLIADGSRPFNGDYEDWTPSRLGVLYGVHKTPVPEFKGVVPAWAVLTDTESVEANGNPIGRHECLPIEAPDFRAVVSRADVYDVDNDRTTAGSVEVFVSIGSNDEITFESADAVRVVASALLKAADELELIQSGAADEMDPIQAGAL